MLAMMPTWIDVHDGITFRVIQHGIKNGWPPHPSPESTCPCTTLPINPKILPITAPRDWELSTVCTPFFPLILSCCSWRRSVIEEKEKEENKEKNDDQKGPDFPDIPIRLRRHQLPTVTMATKPHPKSLHTLSANSYRAKIRYMALSLLGLCCGQYDDILDQSESQNDRSLVSFGSIHTLATVSWSDVDEQRGKNS